MAAVSALEVRITQSERRPDLTRFIGMLGNLSKAMLDIDRAVLPAPNLERPRWAVNDLKHDGLDYIVRLTAATPRKREIESVLFPVEALVAGARDLRLEPEVPDYYTECTISRLVKVAPLPTAGIREVSLATVNGVVGPQVPLDDALLAHARDAVQEAEVSIGSITGRVDTIKRGRNVCTMRIFNPETRRAVSGTAAFGMEDEIREAWGRRITARGRITRNSRGQAVRISVSDIERLPADDAQRARASSLRGTAQHWTDGLTVEEFVDRARRRA